jgi:hypothetical protein
LHLTVAAQLHWQCMHNRQGHCKPVLSIAAPAACR